MGEVNTSTIEWGADEQFERTPSISMKIRGDLLIGRYKASRKIDYEYKGNPASQMLHAFEALETNVQIQEETENGLAVVDFKPGMLLDVWGAGSLNKFLARFQPGQLLRIEYLGKNEGGFHQYSVKASKGEKTPF